MRQTGGVLQAVLFDWDGTLCDSSAAGFRAFTKSLAEFDVAFSLEQYQAVYTPAWYNMYRVFGLPESCWEQADRRWLHHYAEESPGLLAGAHNVLALLRDRGIRFAIVTGGTRGRVEKELLRLGLADAFSAVICHDDVTNKKPHPEGIERALAILGTDPARACYVGDTPEDVLMGKNAGVLTAAVLTAYVACDRLHQCAPDILLPSIDHLPAALLGLRRETPE